MIPGCCTGLLCICAVSHTGNMEDANFYSQMASSLADNSFDDSDDDSQVEYSILVDLLSSFAYLCL